MNHAIEVVLQGGPFDGETRMAFPGALVFDVAVRTELRKRTTTYHYHATTENDSRGRRIYRLLTIKPDFGGVMPGDQE